MLTDSSAEASALGSGPRGRRFKSALSEKRPLIVLVYNSIAERSVFCTWNDAFSGVFSWCLYNSSRKSLWRKLKSIRLDANPVRTYRMIVIYGSLFAILSPFLYWFRTGQETFIIIAWYKYDKTFCRSNICVGHDQLLFFYKQGCLIVMWLYLHFIFGQIR